MWRHLHSENEMLGVSVCVAVLRVHRCRSEQREQLCVPVCVSTAEALA